MQKLFITLLTFVLFSCSDNIIEDTDLKSNIDEESFLSDLEKSSKHRNQKDFGITKLKEIKRLNPKFIPKNIITKSPNYEITTSLYQLKDLNGNVLKEEKNTIKLYQTDQFQRNNFSLRISRFLSGNGTFGGNEQEFLKNAFKRFRKMYSHPHFITYMDRAGITKPGAVVYNKIRHDSKAIVFQRKKGIKAMKANGSKISVSNQIKFTGGVKPLGKLSHEIGHVYGYGHGTNVNAAMERYVKNFYMDGEISNYDLFNINAFKYEHKVEVDAPLNNTWILKRFRKKNKLKVYNKKLPFHPFLQFDLVNGNRDFTGSNGSVSISGQVENLTYDKLNISTITASETYTNALSIHLDKILKHGVSYEIKDTNILWIRNQKGKVILEYLLKSE